MRAPLKGLRLAYKALGVTPAAGRALLISSGVAETRKPDGTGPLLVTPKALRMGLAYPETHTVGRLTTVTAELTTNGMIHLYNLVLKGKTS